MAAGLMRPAGLAAVEAARANGSWMAYDAVDELIVADDLAATLAANPTAQTYFAAFPPSSRKVIPAWIAGARHAETRARRVAETVRLAAENRRANHSRS
jgi:uncharacterized protein YdeI (YjbR/CyaY-like superfamily)